MSELLAISLDCVSSPNLKLNLNQSHIKLAGWGVGWYPNDDYAASVVKDTGRKNSEDMTSALSDWSQFRSTTFLCKIKGAAKKPSRQDTQPFQKSFAGRDWLFLHNGDLDKLKMKELLGEAEGFLEPVGTTDSEMAFCYILKQLQHDRVNRIAEIDTRMCVQWLEKLDAIGAFDMVLSDGQSILVYHGKNTQRALFYSRLTPPYADHSELRDESVTLDFNDAQDTYRSAFIVSSSELAGCSWQKMAPGQTLIVRRAGAVFDSTGHSLQKQEQQVQWAPPFSSTQGEQAQTEPIVTNLKSITRTDDGRPMLYRSYKVTHLTEYTYANEVERSTHAIRMQPVEDKTQEVVLSTMSFSVDGEKLHFEDVFGNQATHVTVETPYTHLSISVESEVKVFARNIDDYSNAMRRTSIPLIWMPWQRQMMLPYLLPPELPEPQLLELTDYAMSFVERSDYHLIDTLNEINASIHRDFKYVQGHTNLQTTPFDVYTSRKGVCQDFANLFICLARLLGVPSRYRVGYIYTGSNYANTIQSEASHAWVEVYLPYIGWRGYDPTNGCSVGQDHIRVACGRNFRDAAPTSGTIFKGGGGERLTVSVRVEDNGKI